MLLAGARLLKGVGVLRSVWTVEHAFRPVAFDAVALDVPEVECRRLGAPGRKAHEVSFDDDAAGAGLGARHADP